MNKIIYKTFIIAFCTMASCSNDNTDIVNDIYLNIPDTSFETILIEQGIDSDGEINQQMLKADAEEVNVLDLSSSNSGQINDITGIEGFKNLKILSAIMHNIERVDLSFNTKLDTIYLQGNYLTSIDFSNNTNLIFADLTSNLLTSVTGVSEATKLKDLRLSDNLLEEFSIDNPTVENLLISHNLLTSFDATGAINLKYILLRLNEITNLDFSSNTLLENVFVDNNKIESIKFGENTHVKYLLLHNNSLSDLDVSTFPELIKLTAHNNPDLTCIKIQNGQEIPTLTISDYQELNQLCDDMYLYIPDTHFETKLVEQGIDSDGIVNQQMLKADAEKVSVLDLNLSANSGEIADLTGIEGFVNLKLLSADNQELELIDLSYNTLLDTLYLSGNKFSSIDLSNNTNLIFVDIQTNKFSSGSSIIGLSNATNLKDLDLSWNYLEDFSIHNESLEVLHMGNNDLKSIDTNGAINLRNVVLASNKLEAVDFSTNTSLETLLLAGNKLEHIDLENNTNLTHLYISSNSLTSLDVSHNQELVDLRVSDNPNLTCIKIQKDQYPYVIKSDYQELNEICN